MSDLTQPPHVPSCVSTGEGVTVPTATARFTITWTQQGYKVSRPNIEEAEVVMASDYDAAQAALAEAKAEVELRRKDTTDLSNWVACKMLNAEWDSFKKSLGVIEYWKAEWNKQTAERVQLRARVAELEQDKARLDWLDSYDSDSYWNDYANPGQRGELRTRLDAARKGTP